MTISGLDRWLTSEPSVIIDPHAPYEAWRTDGMYEPDIPAQVILGDPEDPAQEYNVASFEQAEVIAAIFNSWYERRAHTFDPDNDDDHCHICGEPSPATIARWAREDDPCSL